MAAFIKRLCRLCLTAPVDAVTVVLPLVYNLVLRHEACIVLLHRPGCSGMLCLPVLFSMHTVVIQIAYYANNVAGVDGPLVNVCWRC